MRTGAAGIGAFLVLWAPLVVLLVTSGGQPLEEARASPVAAVASLLGQSCPVSPLAKEERAMVRAAFTHMTRALKNPRVHQRLDAKADDLASTLARAGPNLELAAFDATCSTLKARRLQAFVVPGHDVVLIARDYLDRLAAAPAPQRGRRLAGTLVHEIAHVAGYEHPAPGSPELYATSVPVYASCVVATFPDLEGVDRHCGARDDGGASLSARAR